MESTEMKDLVFSCIDIQDVAIERVGRGDYIFCEAVSVDVASMKRIEKYLPEGEKKKFKEYIIYFSSLEPEFIHQDMIFNEEDKRRQ